jgi:hypothetical protein
MRKLLLIFFLFTCVYSFGQTPFSKLVRHKVTGGGASSLLTGIVSYYKLDGNANDETGTNNGSTGGSFSYVTGKINNAAGFTGAGFVNCNSSLGITGHFTLDAWVNVNNFPSSGNIAAIMSSGFDGSTVPMFLQIDNAGGTLKLEGGVYDGGSGTNATWNISGWSTGAWHYVAVTYDGSNCKVYFDGTLENTTANTANPPSTTAPFCLGTLYFSGSGIRNIDATVDEAGIWSRNLTGAEITTRYNSGSGNSYPF